MVLPTVLPSLTVEGHTDLYLLSINPLRASLILTIKLNPNARYGHIPAFTSDSVVVLITLYNSLPLPNQLHDTFTAYGGNYIPLYSSFYLYIIGDLM